MSTSITKTGILKADGNGVGENLILNSNNLVASCFDAADDSRKEYVAVNVGQSYMDVPTGTSVQVSFYLKMKLNTVTRFSSDAYKFYLTVYNTNNKGMKQFSANPNASSNNCQVFLSGDIGTIFEGIVSVGGFILDRSSYETVTKTDNFLEFYSGYGSNNFFEISNLKLELGNLVTPWIPNPADTMYVSDSVGFSEEGDKAKIWSCGSVTGNEFIQF